MVRVPVPGRLGPRRQKEAMNGSVINSNVLLLNQNYEPLTVCSARRAIVMMFQGKVQLIETANGRKIRSVSSVFDLPSVVRLWHYRKVPHKRIMLTRKNVIARDHHRCQYCGTGKGPMTVDHIVPRMMGGGDTWDNLVCACFRCNNRKGNRTPEAAGMRLLKRPSRPSLIAFLQRNIRVAEQWRPYLFMD